MTQIHKNLFNLNRYFSFFFNSLRVFTVVCLVVAIVCSLLAFAPLGSIYEVLNFAAGDGTPKFNPFFIPKMIADIAPGNISIKNGFMGPNWGILTYFNI